MIKPSKKSLSITLFPVIVILLILHIRYYADYRTTLLSGVYIKDGSADLTANYWSVPVVYDWDSDGKKDLIVGQNYIDKNRVNHGYVRFHKNIGTDSAPLFNGFTYVQTCIKECARLNASAFG